MSSLALMASTSSGGGFSSLVGACATTHTQGSAKTRNGRCWSLVLVHCWRLLDEAVSLCQESDAVVKCRDIPALPTIRSGCVAA